MQFPLYKWKNVSAFDTNNYRGITLLYMLNKLFEVISWERMQVWGNGNEVFSTPGSMEARRVVCPHDNGSSGNNSYSMRSR